MAKNLGSLNIGDLIEVPVKPEYHSFLGGHIVFKVADKNHPGYPENSVTLITDKIIAVMAFDAMEPNSSNIHRKQSGNNRYRYSNILQWMNSNAEEGKWYTPQHSQDEPPIDKNVWSACNSYDQRAGFLRMVDENFVKSLMNTDVLVAIDTFADGGGSETVTSKMFLASRAEVQGIAVNGTMEGTKLPLFSDDNSRKAYPTMECATNNTYPGGGPVKPTEPCYWWLRSIIVSTAASTMQVHPVEGITWGSNAYETLTGFRPLCNVPENLTLTDVPNSRGNYEILPSEPPSISGTDSDLGTKYEGFSYDYTVTDPESEAVTVTEKVNDTILRTYTPELGQVQTLSLSGEAFSSLPNAVHTITITATDSADNVVTRTLTFTKSISGFEIVLKNPLTATIQPRRVYVDVMREIPAGGSFKVEVTNNPYDPEPVWEDCTMAVLRHLCHIFKNTVNEAEQFGVNVRVTVKRSRALTVCWVSGIEINFE